MTVFEDSPSKQNQMSECENEIFRASSRKPVELTGAIVQLRSEEVTPAIGREYYDVNIVDDLMNAEDSEDRLRDLALTSKIYVSYHTPCSFRMY